MRSVRTVFLIGVVGEAVLVAVLAGAGRLGTPGWLAGLGVGVAANGLLARALVRTGASGPGPADLVTLTRATLVGGVTALVAQSFTVRVPVGLLAALVVPALLLDAVDGQVARRTGTVSAVGARFDMETDAFLILALSVLVAGSVGPWVLGIGAARYASGVAGWCVPWLRRPVPPRSWRKVVAAVQGVVLATVAVGILPGPAAAAALLVAMALLAESFGRDVWWLSRQRPRPAVEAVAAEAALGLVRG